MNICPAEIVCYSPLNLAMSGVDPIEQQRNMSTPACLNAMNQTIPPPPKPEYREAHSIQHRLVRRLIPFINASHALETQILSSDNYCGAENAGDFFAIMVECAQVATPSLSERSVAGADQLSTLSGFRLPSIRDLTLLNNLSAKLPLAFLEFSWIIWCQLMVVFAQAAIAYCPRIFENRYHHWSVSLPLARTLCLLGYGALVVQFTWKLSLAMAKDLYIESCLSFQVIQFASNDWWTRSPAANSRQASNTSILDDCRLITDLTANLSLSDRIRAWSIWRGYFLALIDQYSTGDLLPLVVFLIFTVLYSPPVWNLCRRRHVVSSHRSQEEGLQEALYERMKGR